jgi:tRNA 2-thiocytidine biosynthesis protein TtcA
LAYCKEKDIDAYARIRAFPLIPCNLCGSQQNLQRQAMKEMLRDWDRRSPGRVETIFTALQNIAPSQLADRHLFNFAMLEELRGQALDPVAVAGEGLDILAR